jgi:hypothetical protein
VKAAVGNEDGVRALATAMGGDSHDGVFLLGQAMSGVAITPPGRN